MKYLTIKERKMIPITALQSVIVGVIIGVIFFILFKDSLFEDTDFWINEVVQYSKYLDINKMDYFMFLLKQRIKNVISVILCTIIWNYRFAMLVISFVFGIVIGVLLCICLKRWGIIGIFLWLFSNMPQDILYFSALSLWGKVEKKNIASNREIYYTGFDKRLLGRKMIQLLLITVIVITGIIVEYYVNILLLHKIIIIFANMKHNI